MSFASYCWPRYVVIGIGAITSAAILLLFGAQFITFSETKQMSSCSGLLSGGKFYTTSSPSGTKWLPDDCNLKIYTRQESSRCMRNIRKKRNKVHTPYIIFAGDSRIRQLRDGMLAQLTGKDQDWLANRTIKLDPKIYNKHEGKVMLLPLMDALVKLEFIWATNNANLMGSIKKILIRSNRNKEKQRDYKPDLLVLGNGAWTIRDCTTMKKNQKDCVLDYKRHFMKMLPLLTQIGRDTAVVWAPQNIVNETTMWDREFTNATMEMYNESIRSALQSVPNNHVIYWKSFESTFRIDDSLDGLHIGPTAKYYDIQILLNLICNRLTDDMNDNFCCSKSL